jgi:hypothetical protein
VGKFLLVVIVAAAVVYLLVRVAQRRGGLRGPGQGGSPARPARPAPPTRPRGPDDDPEFLRELERRRRAADRRRRAQGEAGSPPPASPNGSDRSGDEPTEGGAGEKKARDQAEDPDES